ncbi:hypothetical protein N665_0275s0053, partial [Sinapis alba]
MEDNLAEKLQDEILVFVLFWPLEYGGDCLKASIQRSFTMVNEQFKSHISIQYSWYRVMEHFELLLKSWQPSWMRQWLRFGGVFFLLYSDVRTI